MLTVGLTFSVHAGKADCANLIGRGAKPVREVGWEEVGIQNDYDEVVKEDDRTGVTYLTFIGGSTPRPNRCGLNSKNSGDEWTGWGGPLDTDNATIGEGAGTRNEIVIGGVYFERGIGSHAVATIIYDLSGDDYLKFEGYIGMSDEKDPGECGHGGSGHFVFNIDGKEVFKSGRLLGTDGGRNVEAVKVEIDIPANARELEIIMGDGGDGISCDHSAIGDAKLLNAQALTVEPANKGIGVGTDSTEVVPDATASVNVSISPSPIQSPAPGEQLVLNLNITGGENVAGYQATVQFDTTALRYVSSANGSYLPAGAFVIPPVVDENRVTLAATSLTGGSQGDGTLATVTFEVIEVKSSVLTLSGVQLTDVDADFLSVSSENGEVVASGTSTKTVETVMSLTPSSVASPTIGEQLTFNVSIADGKNVAGYAFKLGFDATALRYVSGSNADYLPAGAFTIPPLVSGNQVTLVAVSPNDEREGIGTLATVTFEVIAVKPSTLRFSAVSLTDRNANALSVRAKNGEVVESIRIPEDVNGDGVVNLDDMNLAASRVNQRGENTADVNGDGVVDGADLLLIAAAIEQGNAAPSLHPRSVVERFTAAEVHHWLWLARQVDLTDPMHQRGFLLLEQLLEILTPKETTLLSNYPNPFNPETWIPYHLSKPGDVTLRIYTADGRLVRTLALGHQAAGIYEFRSRAAYWDGKNELGESVASGVYFYILTAGDFAATRKMLIRK